MRYVAAVDLSEASLLVLDTLKAIAGDESGEATLLHVVDLDLYTAGGSVPGIMEFACERLTQEAARLEGCGLSAPRIRVEQGDSTQTILRVAAEENADLIVMTNLGKGARTGRLFGSTAERVASSGRVPVLIERVGLPASQEENSCRLIEGSPFGRELVAIDLDHDPTTLLDFVGGLSGVEAMRAVYVARDAAHLTQAKERLDALLAETSAPIGLEASVLVGSPVDAIVGAAADWGATTIAVSPCAHGALHRAIWGSVARGVALGSQCSVLFVPANK